MLIARNKVRARVKRGPIDTDMKWWAFLAFVGSLIFMTLFLKDREIGAGVERLKNLQPAVDKTWVLSDLKQVVQ